MTFGHHTTADEIASTWGERIKGKTVIVTGANIGLGFETARVLAANGAEVILACRNEQNMKQAMEKIKVLVPEATMTSFSLDLGSLDSVRKFADWFKATNKPLHVLINNAGIMGCPLAYTTDGFESQFGVNHLGHYLLTELLWPLLQKSGTKENPSRVVILASKAQFFFSPKAGILFDDLDAKKHYNPWERYGHSKLANVLHAKALSRRAEKESSNIVCVSLHPGMIYETDLKRHMTLIGGLEFVKYLFSLSKLYALFVDSSKTVAQGSSTTVYAALCPDIVPGGYYEDCAISKYTDKHVEDIEMAEKLMQISKELCEKK